MSCLRVSEHGRELNVKMAVHCSRRLLGEMRKHAGRVGELFDKMDRDGNGKISKVEFRKAVGALFAGSFKPRRSDADAVYDRSDLGYLTQLSETPHSKDTH